MLHRGKTTKIENEKKNNQPPVALKTSLVLKLTIKIKLVRNHCSNTSSIKTKRLLVTTF